MSPTERTLKWLRKEGWNVWKVEHWNHFARRRQDLWGFVDVLGLKAGVTLAVQCTSASNVSSRIRKIADHENTPYLREANWKIWVVGWTKGKHEPRVVDVS